MAVKKAPKKKPAAKKRPVGHPPAAINLKMLEKLCGMLCTVQEIAAFFRVSVTTIMNRQAADPKFAEVMARGRAMGSISVRRQQFAMLKAGNSTMGVWLGKQVCGQRDVMKVEASGPDGGPIQTIDPAKLAALSDDELTRIIDTVGRLAAVGTEGGAGSPPPE